MDIKSSQHSKPYNNLTTETSLETVSSLGTPRSRYYFKLESPRKSFSKLKFSICIFTQLSSKKAHSSINPLGFLLDCELICTLTQTLQSAVTGTLSLTSRIMAWSESAEWSWRERRRRRLLCWLAELHVNIQRNRSSRRSRRSRRRRDKSFDNISSSGAVAPHNWHPFI